MYWGYVFTEGNAAIAHGVGQHGVRFACRFVDGTGLLAFAVEEEGDAYALLSYGDVALAHLPPGVEDWPKRTRSTGRFTAFIRIPMARRVLLDVLAELLDQ